MAEESIIKETDNKTSGDAWPAYTVKSSIEAMERLISEHGSQSLTRDQIGSTWDLKPGTGAFNLRLSSCSQYGLFKKEGKDFKASELFMSYKEPLYDNDENKYQIKMFLNAPLYAKIVNDHNNSILPPNEERVANLLKRYNVHPNSVSKASKIFLENTRNLGLLDANNKLKVDLESNDKKTTKNPANGGEYNSNQDSDKPPPFKPQTNEIEIKDYWKFTTRLKGGHVGYIFLPKDFDDDDLDKIVRLAKAQKDKADE